MAAKRTIAILGSGLLTRAVCRALAYVVTDPLDVVVVARSAAGAADICYVSGLCAVLAGTPVTFRSATVDLADTGSVGDVFAGLDPSGILVCASTQSPWERLRLPSAWTALVDRAGFGLTLPFHCELALAAGRAAHKECPDAWFLNACFPDAVNPVLSALQVPVFAGIGNIALVAAGLRIALDHKDERRLALLAHHVHLRPVEPPDEAIGWCDGKRLTDVTALLAPMRTAQRPHLHDATGHTAALLIRDLLSGAELDTHLPGPLGLPGGYPVRVSERGVTLRLPPDLTLANAIAINQTWAMLDGVVTHGDGIKLSDTAAEFAREYAPALADGIRPADITAAAAQLRGVRDQLRKQRVGPNARREDAPPC